MPKGLIYRVTTLMLSALLITFLNAGVGSTDPDKMHGSFVLSPEEEFALTKGEHGYPDTEGYGTTKI